MREIKTRAWLEEKNRYGVQGMFVPSLSEYNNMDDEISNLQSENVIFMQYTGLKDRNDKEIYEGDIVSFNDVGNEIRYIKFEDGGFYCISDGNKYHRKWEINPSEDLEVIGKIYENKKLLEN